MTAIARCWRVLALVLGTLVLAGCECQSDDECGEDQVCRVATVGVVSKCLTVEYVDSGASSCDGAVEVPCNGLDDDCDGEIDEWGQGAECYPTAGMLADPTLNVGLCRSGTWACEEGGAECANAILPVDETCNGRDDDCDGVVDEALDGEGRGASPLTEACEAIGDCPRSRVCLGGAWTACAGGGPDGTPVGEVCNAVDDDCDGELDEGPEPGDPPVFDPARADEMVNVGRDCVARDDAGRPLAGACRRFGTIRCDPVALSVGCDAVAATPGDERCDETPPADAYIPAGDAVDEPGYPEPVPAEIVHQDEDCDGKVDETGPEDGVGTPRDWIVAPLGEDQQALAFGAACAVGDGLCAGDGAIACLESGVEAACDGEPVPARAGPEVCALTDGEPADEDCDGVVDEGEAGERACGTGIGVCVAGTETCVNGAYVGCDAVAPAVADADWCDGLNNDCDCGPDGGCGDGDTDGLVDEGCSCLGPGGAPLSPLQPDGRGRMFVRTVPLDMARPDRVDALGGSCGGDGGREVALQFTAPTAGVWRFRARAEADSAGDPDPVLYVTEDCASHVPGSDPTMVEEGCLDDDGAVRSAGDILPDGDAPIDFEGASVAANLQQAGQQLTVVVDGAGPGEDGEWQLDTHRIDEADCDPGPAERRRPKLFFQPVRGWQSGFSRCEHRRVDKADGGAEVGAGDGLCVHNDGVNLAAKLDPNGGALQPGQEARVQGRLLPRAVDEADWYSVELASGGREVTVSLGPGPENDDRLLGAGGAADDLVGEDGFPCLAEWVDVVGYVACTEGRPRDVLGCARLPNGHLTCAESGGGCQDDVSFRELRLRPDGCQDADGELLPDARLLLFVGLLRRNERAQIRCNNFCAVNNGFGPVNDARAARPDRCATYDLTIEYGE